MTTTQATEPMADEATEPMADETTDELDPFADGATLPLRPSLEAVLMVADQPLDHLLLAQAVGAPPAEVAEALQALAAEYTKQGRGFDLRNTGGGWRFYSREEFAPVVEQFVVDGQQARLTQAALETLAVIAYREPVSRARVSAIRGVNVDSVVRTLVSRGLVEEAGNDAETGAHLYRTTSYFLERIGLRSLDELPEIAPFLPEMGDIEGELEEFAAAPDPAASETPTPVTAPEQE
ncbi:MAG: SMC-Scp complex subunit ScpB [Nocardioidaceae bacterium]